MNYDGQYVDVSFEGKDMTGATLSGIFVDADFRRSTLIGVKFTGGSFTNVDFTGAIVEHTVNREAASAKLRHLLTTQARTVTNVILPDGSKFSK